MRASGHLAQVLGNIKVVLLILVSVAIFGNEVSLQAGTGCALCIGGVVLYNAATRSKPAGGAGGGPPATRTRAAQARRSKEHGGV
jgi:hypothetical protein